MEQLTILIFAVCSKTSQTIGFDILLRKMHKRNCFADFLYTFFFISNQAARSRTLKMV